MTDSVPSFPARRRSSAAWPDADLIASCIRGDQRAWDELVDRYGRLVYSVARRHGLTATDADDVFQQVFAIAHRKLHNLRDAGRLPAWLSTTTLRECRRFRRWLPGRGSLGELAATQEAPEQDVAALERQELVRLALRRLGGRDERLLTALFFGSEPPDYRRIARALGMRQGSIGPTRARSFRKLEKILIELGLGETAAETPLPACRRSRLAG